MLFKLLMKEALVDNQTTKTMYRTNLVSLNVHIGVMKSDREFFDKYVLDHCQALKKHDHDIDDYDMLECLLDVYLLAQDNKFHAYIVQLKTSIDDGTLTQTAKQLMGKAINF